MRNIFNALDTTPTPECQANQASYAAQCVLRATAVGAQTIAEKEVTDAEKSIAANRALRKTKFSERTAQDVIFEAQKVIIKQREDDNKLKNARISKNNTAIEEAQAIIDKNKPLIATQQKIVDAIASTKKQVAAALAIIKPLRAANNIAINEKESLNRENAIKQGIITKNNTAITAATAAKNAALTAYKTINAAITAIDLEQGTLRAAKAAAETAVDTLTTQIASIDATLEELAAVMAASTPACAVTPCD
jgi:chromosome segregation ATPase